MFISQKRFDEEINKAYMRGYYDGKLIGEMGAERKQKVNALRKKFDFATTKDKDTLRMIKSGRGIPPLRKEKDNG